MLDKLKAAAATPWRISNEARRLVALPVIRLTFAMNGIEWGRGWRVFGAPIIQRHAGSEMVLGDGLELRSWLTANPLAPAHPVVLATRTGHARLRVGAHCGFTGATLVAANHIEIGDRVLVGANATIVDTDFHPLEAERRRADIHAGESAPVFIEDDVFIGMNVLVLKGVRLGRGCVIGAGSVVTHDVPAGMLAAGNPAKVIRPVEK